MNICRLRSAVLVSPINGRSDLLWSDVTIYGAKQLMRSESLLGQAIAQCLLTTSGGSNQESESARVPYQITEWLNIQSSMQQTQPTRSVNIHLWLDMHHTN